MTDKPKRVLLGKVGLDGHSRGVHIVAKALVEAGFEIIYTGIRRTPADIANAAVEEDVSAVGLSCLSGAHLSLFKETADLLREKGATDLALFCGGIIPDEDFPALREAGFEVSYTGLHKTPKEIVKLAMDNDVDIIGLSVLSGAHIPICTEMVEEMKARVEATPE